MGHDFDANRVGVAAAGGANGRDLDLVAVRQHRTNAATHTLDFYRLTLRHASTPLEILLREHGRAGEESRAGCRDQSGGCAHRLPPWISHKVLSVLRRDACEEGCQPRD